MKNWFTLKRSKGCTPASGVQLLRSKDSFLKKLIIQDPQGFFII